MEKKYKMSRYIEINKGTITNIRILLIRLEELFDEGYCFSIPLSNEHISRIKVLAKDIDFHEFVRKIHLDLIEDLD